MSVETFERWKSNPSADQNVDDVELLSALAYGRLRIESEEGSSIVLDSDFYVDSAGLVKTTAELNIAERRVLSGDAEYPRGPVRASFFQTDHVSVGRPFQIVTYDTQTKRGIVAVLYKVVRVTIDQEGSPR